MKPALLVQDIQNFCLYEPDSNQELRKSVEKRLDVINEAISFRRYEPGDLSTCTSLAEDAWPPGPGIVSKKQETSGMKGYIGYSVGLANWTDMACASEGVVGFLFGRIDKYPGAPVPKRSPLGELPTFIRSFFIENRMTPKSISFTWSLFLTELKVKLRIPKSDASIEMFIVCSKHRGKGVGSELIDRFLRAARKSGSSLVTVYTDNMMSNWQFYEKRGFKRVETFHDNITSHYSGLDSTGIIFALDLREGKQKTGSEST
jgi:ribosomal protein S18 acetylase RimI-like enzyme